MYFGIAILVDNPYELWHSKAQASSIRSTSGKYGRYPNNTPIFPLDTVFYQYYDKDYVIYKGGSVGRSALISYIGRVVEVWRDCRNVPLRPGKKDDIIAKIEPLTRLAETVSTLKRVFQRMGIEPSQAIPSLPDDIEPKEHVIIEDKAIYIAANNIIRRYRDAFYNLSFGSSI